MPQVHEGAWAEQCISLLEKWKCSSSVVFNSLQPYGLPGSSVRGIFHSRVGCHFLLQLVWLGCLNKGPQIEWLQQQKCIVIQFWRLDIWDQDVRRVGGRDRVPCLSSGFWWLAGNLWCPLICRNIIWFLLSSSHVFVLVCVSVFKFTLSSGCQSYWIGAHSTLVCPHLN